MCCLRLRFQSLCRVVMRCGTVGLSLNSCCHSASACGSVSSAGCVCKMVRAWTSVSARRYVSRVCVRSLPVGSWFCCVSVIVPRPSLLCCHLRPSANSDRSVAPTSCVDTYVGQSPQTDTDDALLFGSFFAVQQPQPLVFRLALYCDSRNEG